MREILLSILLAVHLAASADDGATQTTLSPKASSTPSSSCSLVWITPPTDGKHYSHRCAYRDCSRQTKGPSSIADTVDQIQSSRLWLLTKCSTSSRRCSRDWLHRLGGNCRRSCGATPPARHRSLAVQPTPSSQVPLSRRPNHTNSAYARAPSQLNHNQLLTAPAVKP